MIIAVPVERQADETRVAATPDSVKRLINLGFEVKVESGAGTAARFSDDAYRESGAEIVADAATLLGEADIVLKVQRPLTGAGGSENELALIKRGAVVIGIMAPSRDGAVFEQFAQAGLTLIAMELMPRITRAQSMDILSSQSNLAGYKAVVDAAAEFGRAMPMMMTAAGTIAPARVMVLGAGVAGLQAIATARRLGAIVSATDVRPVAKEQVESLGAKFVMVESEEGEQAETEGGYAREMSEDYQRRQAELVKETMKTQDIVICTALIPGRPAPVLITDDMVESMRPGSIIIDLAVEQGGNCTLSKPGEIVEVNGVKIVGHLNVPGRLAIDASALYARNLVNFLSSQIAEETNEFKLDWNDEIVTATALTHDGKVIHPLLTEEAK